MKSSNSNPNLTKNQKGQTFVEFVLMLAILISISFTLMRGFRTYIGIRWETMLKIIAAPNSKDITIP